jgi:hypothetical protein
LDNRGIETYQMKAAALPYETDSGGKVFERVRKKWEGASKQIESDQEASDSRVPDTDLQSR